MVEVALAVPEVFAASAAVDQVAEAELLARAGAVQVEVETSAARAPAVLTVTAAGAVLHAAALVRMG